jgi:hypothetical protein
VLRLTAITAVTVGGLVVASPAMAGGSWMETDSAPAEAVLVL